MTSYFPQWVQDLNTALSFFGFLFTTLGFALTIYVTYQVSHIRKHYLARGRLPSVVKDLEAIGSALSAHLANWPANEHAFNGQIQLTVPLLKTASRMVRRADGAEVRELARSLARKKKGANSAAADSDAWAMYYEVQKVVMALSQVVKNMDWE